MDDLELLCNDLVNIFITRPRVYCFISFKDFIYEWNSIKPLYTNSFSPLFIHLKFLSLITVFSHIYKEFYQMCQNISKCFSMGLHICFWFSANRGLFHFSYTTQKTPFSRGWVIMMHLSPFINECDKINVIEFILLHFKKHPVYNDRSDVTCFI